MYSGFITVRHTADWLGVHQKFNRSAYRHVPPHVQISEFPSLDRIQHFEGYNGPDGMKIKSLHRGDEPSHFYNPETETGPLLEHVENHYHSLVTALAEGNQSRAAFEAAWLAHTVTDGLTPAHHEPYEEELHEMYHDNGGQAFVKPRHKVIIQGERKVQALKQNWQMWGRDGLLSRHIYFELGVATAVLGSRIQTNLAASKLKEARKVGAIDFFKQEAAGIHELRLYDQFRRTSWTAELGRTVRRQLAPTVVEAIAVEWILAAEAAGLGK